jgi:hypothetical protein
LLHTHSSIYHCSLKVLSSHCFTFPLSVSFHHSSTYI